MKRSGGAAGDGRGEHAAKRSVGIVIRTWNEVDFLRRCIASLKSQRMGRVSDMEIQVIDSYSTDGTIELSKAEGCTLIEIPKSEFNYGGSLNTGIEALDKELIISLSAHAIPADEGFLEALTAPFDDPSVAGAYVKQIPWPDAPFIEKTRILKTFDDAPATFSAPGDPAMHFSNVASCFRRSLWEKTRFHALPSSEDFYWAEAMLQAGRRIVYVPGSAVYHSHKDSCAALARRSYTILRNELIKENRSPAGTALRVLKASLSHIKHALVTCAREKGGFGEKADAILRSFVEAFLINIRHIQVSRKK